MILEAKAVGSLIRKLVIMPAWSICLIDGKSRAENPLPWDKEAFRGNDIAFFAFGQVLRKGMSFLFLGQELAVMPRPFEA